MSQFSGPGRPSGAGDDEDLTRSPSYGADATGPVGGPSGTDHQFTYYSEERYWTDYLRIAAPVLGVILLLGLLWFWIGNLIGKPSTPPTSANNGAPALITSTPATAAAVATPRPLTTTTGQGTPAAGTIGVGSKVLVANTGGAGLRMHSTPSTSGSVVATLPDGTQLSVTGASVQANGYTWWPVKSATQSGYVVSQYLKASP